MKPDGWMILNSPEPPSAYAEMFPGRNVATVDATGSRCRTASARKAVPIVNTTVLGAVAKVFGLTLKDVEGALELVGFGGANVTSASRPLSGCRRSTSRARSSRRRKRVAKGEAASISTRPVGGMPAIQTGTGRAGTRIATADAAVQRRLPGGERRARFRAGGGARRTTTRRCRSILEDVAVPGHLRARVPGAVHGASATGREHDEAVNVREIERYVGDHAQWPSRRSRSGKEKIAVSAPARRG
jgi:hypothetical protein